MLKTVIAGVGAVAMLAVALPAAAAPPAPQPVPVASAPVDPKAETLVRRYLAAIRFERTMDVLQAAMLPVISDQMARQQPGLTAENRQMIVDVVRRVMREKMMPQMIDRMVPIYATTFTVPELEALVTFYEGPTGRSITDKVPSLAPKSAEIARELMPQVISEVIKEVIDGMCPGGKCTPPEPKISPS